LFICIKKQQKIWTEFKTRSQIIYLYIVILPTVILLHLYLVISSKSLLLLLQEFQTESVSFDRSSQNPYLPLSSHQYCMFLFLFGLLFFTVKLKYTNCRVYYSYCRDDNIADQCITRKSNPEHFNRRGL
jgi:hypothetical protein